MLAVRVANGDENGYPAILVRLKAIGVDELRELLVDAWRVQAPRKLVKAYDTRT